MVSLATPDFSGYPKEQPLAAAACLCRTSSEALRLG